MSRSRHQKYRQNGKDLWSKRPCSGMSVCKYNRKLTARKERCIDKSVVNSEVEEVFKGAE